MRYVYIGFENFSGAYGFVSKNIFKLLLNFLCFLKTSYPKTISIFGFIVFFCILFQCLSGLIIAFSLIADPMIIPMSRDEEDIDDLYTDDFFFLHERGVDFIFIFIFIHLFRKLYLNSYSKEQEIAWKNGIFLFLLFHGTVFFGLVLCCTHLSDITLTIAANIINTLTFKYGKLHWFLFTDQTLNSDTIIRCMYIHYILGFICLIVGYVHSNIMHYDYKDQNEYTGIDIEIDWFKDIAIFELDKLINILLILYILSNFFIYFNIEALSYEIFMWGDVGFVSDVRFLGVAPHWYFRSYMGWLLLCPHHYIGIFGLLFLLIIFYFQVNIKNVTLTNYSFYNSLVFFNDISIISNTMFFIFLFCFFYTFSMLPYGRFYNAVGGNIGLLFSYLYIFFFLSVNVNKLLINIINNRYINTLQFYSIKLQKFLPKFILNMYIVKLLYSYYTFVYTKLVYLYSYINYLFVYLNDVIYKKYNIIYNYLYGIYIYLYNYYTYVFDFVVSTVNKVYMSVRTALISIKNWIIEYIEDHDNFVFNYFREFYAYFYEMYTLYRIYFIIFFSISLIYFIIMYYHIFMYNIIGYYVVNYIGYGY